jgi:hypothetical protein
MMDMTNTKMRLRQILKAYYIAKETLLREGYAGEVDWQYGVSLEKLDEGTFLRETAWVILASGIRETVIRQKFSKVSQSFFDWESATKIVRYADLCRSNALCHFAHPGKVDAILTVATHIHQQGFNNVATKIRERGVEYLQGFPFLGPTTSYHLAKNIGFPVAKPDRHLCKMAEKLGYISAQQLCADISELTGEPIPVVDIVLWRYSARYTHNIERFVTFLNSAH